MKKCFYIAFVILVAGFVNTRSMEEDSAGESSSNGQKKMKEIPVERWKRVKRQRDGFQEDASRVLTVNKKLKAKNQVLEEKCKALEDRLNNSPQINNDASLFYLISKIARKESFWWIFGSLSVVLYGFYNYMTFKEEDDSDV